MQEFFEYILLEIGDYELVLGPLIISLLLTAFLWVLHRYAKRWLDQYIIDHPLDKSKLSIAYKFMLACFLLVWLIFILYFMRLDYVLWQIGSYALTPSRILAAILIIVVARWADEIMSARVIEEMKHYHESDFLKSEYANKDRVSRINRIIQYILIAVVAIGLIKNFNLDFPVWSFQMKGEEVTIFFTNILWAALIILITRLIIWLFINFVMYGWYRTKAVDIGKQFAYNQLVTYLIYTFGVIIALQTLGINMTLLWAGAAALLVGVGIALQQTISDFFSGIVLLFERSVEVGDFLEVGKEQGTIRKIGMRASIMETLDRRLLVIPNSKLTNYTVTNWSNEASLARFDLSVSVAYGSNTGLVKKLLLESLEDIPGVLKKPVPFVLFSDFGESALDFDLYFFSRSYSTIELIKSDIRFEIDRLFQENDISIPFPQRDVWMRSEDKS